MVSMRNTGDNLVQAMDVLRTIDPEITVLYAQIFVMVGAAHPKPCPMNGFPERFGVTRASTSRAHAWLSSFKYLSGKQRIEGHGLIVSEENPDDRRKLELRLTAKGRTVYQQVIACLEKPAK